MQWGIGPLDPSENAHEVHGAIRDKWAALGGERSFLGYPSPIELGTPGPGWLQPVPKWCHSIGLPDWRPEVARPGTPPIVISLDKISHRMIPGANITNRPRQFCPESGRANGGEPLIRHMGDVNNGDHLVGLHFGPFPIDNPAAPFIFNYQIVNSGHGNQDDIRKH